MKALIRADASVEIGMGHRVRCQALIGAFERLGWQCQYVVHQQYKDFADENDLFVESEEAFFVLAKQADLVILDHYAYQADDITRLFQYQPSLLVLDDMNDRGDFPAKWLLNPLDQSYSSRVEVPLTGSQYALLRPAFVESRATSLPSSSFSLLITLGGTDPLALTLPLLKALEQAAFSLDSVQVLLGKNAKNSQQVISYCEEKSIAWQQGLSDVTPLMHQAKMAISAAGGTLFELACMGVPTVFAQVAENQTRSLEQHVPLGWCDTIRFDGLDEASRTAQVTRLITMVTTRWHDNDWLTNAKQIAQQLVDGKGADRVANTIHRAIQGR